MQLAERLGAIDQLGAEPFRRASRHRKLRLSLLQLGLQPAPCEVSRLCARSQPGSPFGAPGRMPTATSILPSGIAGSAPRFTACETIMRPFFAKPMANS
jgi:hypothetical protein